MTEEPNRPDRSRAGYQSERARALTEVATAMWTVSRRLTAGLDRYVVSTHPDLAALDEELDNTYPTAFDDLR